MTDIDFTTIAGAPPPVPAIRPTPVRVTRHVKGWKKCIGRYVGTDRRARAKIWWFCSENEAEAMILAGLVHAIYRDRMEKGMGAIWTEEAMAFAARAVEHQRWVWRGRVATARQAIAFHADGTQPTSPGGPVGRVTTPAGKEKTLYQAIAAYVASVKGKPFSPHHKARVQNILNTNLKRVAADVPMGQVDFAFLDKIADHFRARPLSHWTKRRMKPETVRTLLRYIKRFFAWCDEVEYDGWQAPRRVAKVFRVRTGDLLTPAERRKGGTIEQFDVSTLVRLYRSANDRQRMYLLTALFAGSTQREMAVMEKSEFDLEKAVLSHHRSKTGVLGTFWLPEQLVELIRNHWKDRKVADDKETLAKLGMTREELAGLAFLTEDGYPLVWFDQGGKLGCDSVRLTWNRLREKAQLPEALSFKFLRKYLGDYMTRHGGEAMGQTALSHAPATVLAKHYTSTRPFDQFHHLARQMHAELTAAGMFQEAQVNEKADCHIAA